MASRLELHDEFCNILGTRYVYFQPPASIKLTYPCIVYSISGIEKHNANDKTYRSTTRYEVTVIDFDPDSELLNQVLTHFPMCSFDRGFTSDNLNHYVFTLYY